SPGPSGVAEWADRPRVGIIGLRHLCGNHAESRLMSKVSPRLREVRAGTRTLPLSPWKLVSRFGYYTEIRVLGRPGAVIGPPRRANSSRALRRRDSVPR